MSHARMERLRLCVVGSSYAGSRTADLVDLGVEVYASVPTPQQVELRIVREYDVVMISATAAEIVDAAWRDAVRRIAPIRPVLVSCSADALDSTSVVVHRLGAAGAIASNVSPQALRRTIAAVARGEAGFARRAVSTLLRVDRGSWIPVETGRGHLTPRQRQVTGLIAEGATDREIAQALHISESTAHKHVQNALRRSGARSRSHLVARMNLLATA